MTRLQNKSTKCKNTFDGVGEISTELREGIVYYIQRKGILAA